MSKSAIAKKEVNADAGSVSFNFNNGESLTTALSSLPETIVRRLALHGLSQKIGDSYSGAAGSVETALAMAKRTADNLAAGNWGVERAGGGGRLAQYIEAISRLTGQETDAVVAMVDQLTDEQVAELKKRPDVKGMVDIIKAEKAQSVVANSDLASSLGL